VRLKHCEVIKVAFLDGAGVSSLPSVLSSQTSNRLNHLTPSLSKIFRADLISHVTNWPSEILEKQVIQVLLISKKYFSSFQLVLGTKMR
jgi:hypothetical protein